MEEYDFRSKEANYIIFTAVKGLWAPGWTLDDLLNEARVGIWEASQSWKSDGGMSWRAYAVMIARRKILDIVVHANRQKNHFMRHYAGLETAEVFSIPEESFEYNESKQILSSLLEQVELTLLEKSVLDLRLLDYKYGEIAKELGISYKQVDNAIQRIVRKLREIPTPETLLSSRG